MRRKNKMKKKVLMSLGQIFILIIGIFAIGYALGSEVRVVSAADPKVDGCIYISSKTQILVEPFGSYEDYVAQRKLKNDKGNIISGVKYYRNQNIGIWKKIYGAYYLANNGNEWYFWNRDTDKEQQEKGIKFENIYAWEKINAEVKSVSDEKCEKAFDYDSVEEIREKEDEIMEEKEEPEDKTPSEGNLCIRFQQGGKTYYKTYKNVGGTVPPKASAANLQISPDIYYKDTSGTTLHLLKTKSVNNYWRVWTGSWVGVDDSSFVEIKSLFTKCGPEAFVETNEKDETSTTDGLPVDYTKFIDDYGDILDKEKYSNYDECIEAGEKKEDCEKAFPTKEDKTTGDYKEAPLFGGQEWYGYLFGHIAEGAMWATAVWGGIQALKAVLPEDYHDLADTYASTLFGAILAGKSVTGALEAFIPGMRALETGKEGITISKAGWIGIGAAAAYFLFAFRYESYEVVTFECIPWDAPIGGDNCNECNNQGILSCSEYQCKSLGQGCELINKGTDEEKCAWVNRGDVEFPRIEAWEEALINEDYVYNPDDTISPPDRGVRIEYSPSTTGCVEAFTPLSFGIKLTNEDGEPEPAKCKLDTTRKESFDDMRFYFSDGLLLEEHSYSLSLPGAGGDLEIENDGEYSIYVRCQDANGNSNVANFVFNFCVQTGPDTTPPLIVQTSIPSGMPIAYNQTSVDLEVYINEPVTDCRWSHQNQGYENMEGEMDCTGGDDPNDVNNQGLYTCETTLDGIKDRQENKFYFRCEDTTGNVNSESYEFILIGTQPLVIDWVKPENESIIRDSTEAVKVTLEAYTSAGYDEGKSNCYFSDTGEEDDYTLFFNTGSYEHSQDLWLPEDSYEYFIKCVDLGGNYDIEVINFEVESDSEPPIVVRAYHEEIYLKIITNEAARCVYDTKYENYPCDYAFDDGTPMTSLEDVNHYTNWNPEKTFYIICQDEYGTQPDPDECSIIVRPSDLY